MQTYSVKEIAELLNTNPETVRRWIRSGKLKSDIDSRKGGNVVTQQMLDSFLKDSPKYAKIAGTALATPFGIGLLSATLAGGVLTAQFLKNEKIKNAKVDATDIIPFLKNEIKTREDALKQKKATVEQLQLEINQEKQAIDEITKLITELESK